MFVLSAVVTVIVIPTIRYFALKLTIVDQRSKRKIHNRIVTRFGGLAIYAGFIFAMINVFLFNSRIDQQDFLGYMALIIASTLILLLGLFDDVKGANAFIKFSVQILAAWILIQAGFIVKYISNPFGDSIVLGIFAIPFTILWLIGITNAINLIDGLDGLAAGIVFIVSGSMAWMFIASGCLMPAFFAIALAGACLGFLRYNYSPAKIFMGDTGSLFLGFSVAALAILTNRKGYTTIGLLLPVIIGLGIPIYDTLLALFRRLVIKKVNPFQADNEHIHHALLRLKLKPESAVIILWALTVIFNIVAVVFYYYLHKSP